MLARSRAEPPERLLTLSEGAHGACHGCEGMGETPRKLCFEIPILRQLPSQATRLVFVYDAGPCGSWLSRSLTTKGYDCWGVAPAPLPKQAEDRVKTDRRAALKLAQLLRSGDLTPVSVPTREEEAMRALCRARAEALRDLKAAPCRLKPCCCGTTAALRAQPPGTLPAAGGSLQSSGLPRLSTSCSKHKSAQSTSTRHVCSVSHTHATHTPQPGVCIPSSPRSRPCAACRAPWR